MVLDYFEWSVLVGIFDSCNLFRETRSSKTTPPHVKEMPSEEWRGRWWRGRERDGTRTFGSEELSGDVESFAADDDDLLAIEELLGDYASKSTK